MPYYSEPAFTQPAPAPEPLTEITLEWDTTGVCKATVSLDLARELFGLGGTPVDEMVWRIAALASAQPSLMLSKLGPYVDDEQMYPTKLRKVNGYDSGDL
jgi:hypothetical protein